MLVENIAQKLVKLFIANNMSGLLARTSDGTAVRTVNTNNGESIVFAITPAVINVVHYNQKDKKSANIAIVNSHDPDVAGQLMEIIDIIKDDYENAECEWLNLPNGYEPFAPSDWWKYGVSPVSE